MSNVSTFNPIAGTAAPADEVLEQFVQATEDMPVELRMSDGVLEVQKNVAFCHQDKWRPTYCMGIGTRPEGAGKNKYTYMCNICGSKWTQIRPEYLDSTSNPMISASKRAMTEGDSVRSDGYRCKDCGLKKNPDMAVAAGEASCSCGPKKARKAAATDVEGAPDTLNMPPLQATVRATFASEFVSSVSSGPSHSDDLLPSSKLQIDKDDLLGKLQTLSKMRR